MDSTKSDRLSNLSDGLIHKIFSSLDITQAIETCVLSSRWRYTWTSMPYLNFSTEELRNRDSSKFVKHVLSSRNSRKELFSVRLTFCGKDMDIIKTILKYAFSHNVQKLVIKLLQLNKETKFPLDFLRSESLKHLTLDGPYLRPSNMTSFIWDLPALTTLILKYFIICDDNKCASPFSNCANLKNLTLDNCELVSRNNFNICHPGLSSLTLHNICNSINIVTPQLKNLTIRYQKEKLIISAPNLSSMHYTDNRNNPLDLSADFLNLEKVDICIYTRNPWSQQPHDVRKVIYMLQQLHSVKFLTLNLETIETLSSSLELISHLPSPLTNLKSLTIYPTIVTLEEKIQEKKFIPAEVKNYLLDGSLGANFTMVSHEEIRAMMNVALAEKLMRKVPAELDKLKNKCETYKTDMVQDNAPMQNHLATMDDHFWERMTRVDSCWEDLDKHLENGFKQPRSLISMLREIEGILAKLPALHRAKLQETFSGLCAEADNVMHNMNVALAQKLMRKLQVVLDMCE